MSKRLSTALLLLLAVLSGGAFAQDMSLSETLSLAERADRRDWRSVRTIQTQLAYYSYYAGPIDGVWGPQTDMAIILAHRAEQPRLFQVIEHGTNQGTASLVPISSPVRVVPASSYVTLPHIDRVVPEYYHIEGQGTVWLDIAFHAADVAQRYQTLSVDRIDGYRVITPAGRVPVVRN